MSLGFTALSSLHAYALLEGMVPHFNDADGDNNAAEAALGCGVARAKEFAPVLGTGRERGGYDVYAPTRMLAACVFNYDDV